MGVLDKPPHYPPKRVLPPADGVMPFGKYRGHQIDDIIDIAPDYIEWLDSNVPYATDVLTPAQKRRARDVYLRWVAENDCGSHEDYSYGDIC